MSAAAAAASAGFPKWALLELYTFRRDDDDSFPDESEAPIRASGVTTLGDHFRIAFSICEPPRISRLYAQLPGFPDPIEAESLTILATHHHLALLLVGTKKKPSIVQNFLVFRVDENNPSSSTLRGLPTCTEPKFDYSRGTDRLRPRPSSNATSRPRLLDMISLGLWCGGDKEELVVAELTAVYTPTLGRRCTKAFADICLLRSSADNGDQLATGTWRSMRVEIPAADDDLLKLSRWQTDAVVPFQRWLCWIDYQQGILFCDVSNKELTPSILWFPPLTNTRKTKCNIFYGGGGVSVTDNGCLLKFVNVTRHDGLSDGPLKPRTGFTITCHTLVLGLGGHMDWKKDYTVTSKDLHDFQRGIPMFPQVDILRPHVVHFLFIEFGCAYEKMSVLSIDMSTKTVESFYPYMDGNRYLRADDNECPPTDDTDFIIIKSMSPTPTPFLPCEFPGFCRLSRKRKNME
ncbi:unnamed protein product [Urochloa humidicola]